MLLSRITHCLYSILIDLNPLTKQLSMSARGFLFRVLLPGFIGSLITFLVYQHDKSRSIQKSLSSNLSPEYISPESPIHPIKAKSAFLQLDSQSQKYAYYLSQAAREGSRIIYFQKSFESPALLYLILSIFEMQSIPELKPQLVSANNFTELEWNQTIAYLAGFLQNHGNFRGLSDKKFIPEIPEARFHKALSLTKFCELYEDTCERLWSEISKEIYREESVGFPEEKRVNSYYSSSLTKADGLRVQKVLDKYGVSSLNTRLLKMGDSTFTLLVASILQNSTENQPYINQTLEYENVSVTVTYGDFSPFLKEVVTNLEKAKHYANNTIQVNMLDEYIHHFLYGNIENHRKSQIHWIKDISPIVETNLGFVETYTDPLQMRAEFDGFVAIQNLQQSKILQRVVVEAPKSLSLLPWPKSFEKDTFLKPDFVSLEVLTLAMSGTPLGINIPNYDDIRQEIGFKNVNFGNCYAVIVNKTSIDFIDPADNKTMELMIKYFDDSMFAKVTLHELLGHGSGKLFQENPDGSLNFDVNQVRNPLNQEKITSWYTKGTTYYSTFGSLANPMEECRAEAIAIYLACFDEVLSVIFPGREVEFDDIRYVLWLVHFKTTIHRLESYSLNERKWGQAHAQADYVTVKHIERNSKGLFDFSWVNKEGKPYFYLKVDRSKIVSHGKEVIKDLLLRLQVYRSTANVQAAKKLFESLSHLDEKWQKVYGIVMENRKPKRIETQDGLKLSEDGKSVELVEFGETLEGVLQSWLFHNKLKSTKDDLRREWRKYKDHFKRHL